MNKKPSDKIYPIETSKMKRFAFVNEAAEREYKSLPDKIQDDFGKDLRRIQFDEEPRLSITHLDSVGQGVIELRKNGSPAFRCVYITKYLDTVLGFNEIQQRCR
jgi:Phage derived protein Gp49-like (DUF891).